MPEPRPGSHLGFYRAGITGSLHRRSITVGRESLLQDTLEILRKGVGKKPKHHFLFIGPRGIGKTHLLSLIEDSVSEDPDLRQAYHVVRFPEESHRILSFSDFLLGFCEILRDTLPDEPHWAELYGRLSIEEHDQKIIDTLVPRIRERRRQRSFIILLENLNQILDVQFRDSRHAASLRGFLMEDNGCLLMATAPLHFGAIADHMQPFYDFFDVQFLEQLSEEQTIDLIRRNLDWEQRSDLLAEFDSLQPKLMALYRMTGGSPRLTLMLYELIAHDAVSEVRLQFQLLLDRITPFYQDRMRELGPQESALLETMASMRDQEKTPSSIAARLRMKPSHVSSLLARLLKSQYLRSFENPADKRSRLYAIREGFFDIWLAMNITRGARQRLPFLIEFFAEFYPSIQARNRKREEYRQRLAQGEFSTPDSTTARSDLLDGLDLLSEVGSEAEKAAEKLRLARLHADDGNRERAQGYLQEVRRLPLEGMGQWIVQKSGLEPDLDYLADIEELIACWDTYRSGNLEAFANRIRASGEALSYRSWSETRIAFLRDHLALLPDARDRAETRLKIGSFLATLARWPEAETELRGALEEAGTIDDPLLLSTSLSALGKVFASTNRYSDAELLYRRVLQIVEARCGADHPDVAAVLNNLGELLSDTNRHSEAEPLYRRALQISESSYGPDHPCVAIFINNLANILRATNRYSEAEPLYRRALQITESSCGPDHPSVAIRLNNLANLLSETNRHSEAEPLCCRALQISESSDGPDHPTIAIRLNNLASIFEATNRLSEAEPLYRRALQIFESSYGPNHPRVAVGLNNLAGILGATNRLSEAEHLYRRALQISESSYGPNHPCVAVGLNNLAGIIEATNRLSEAEPLYRRALQISESSYGTDHIRVSIGLNNLAGVLEATNRLSEAEPLYRRALQISESSFGPCHPDVATSLNNLAGVLEATDRVSEAEPLYRRALQIYESSYGPDDPRVAIVLNNLAGVLKATNCVSEAESLFLRALQISEATHVPGHPTVAIGLNNLASILIATNRLSEAEPLLRRALSILGQFQIQTGHEHPHFKAVKRNYEPFLGSQGPSTTSSG